MMGILLDHSEAWNVMFILAIVSFVISAFLYFSSLFGHTLRVGEEDDDDDDDFGFEKKIL